MLSFRDLGFLLGLSGEGKEGRESLEVSQGEEGVVLNGDGGSNRRVDDALSPLFLPNVSNESSTAATVCWFATEVGTA